MLILSYLNLIILFFLMNQGFRENLRKYVDPLGDLGIRALRDVGFFDYWISRHPETGSIILDEVKRSPEYREAIGFELTDQKTVLGRALQEPSRTSVRS